MIHIKNCGLRTESAMKAAIESGADFLGFIHYPKSVRHITPQAAAALCQKVPVHIKKVAVLVNPSDAQIAEIVALSYADFLQLHGDESPQRVAEIRALSGLGIIKALGIAKPEDLAQIAAYEAQADHLLLDTKSPDYGGTGTAFDWSLLTHAQFNKPWFLSGGLNIGNITQALKATGAPMIDVSSGIEREKGVKDEAMIDAFNNAARG